MAEAAGLAIGAASIPIAFKGAVDTGLFIGSFFDAQETSGGYAALCYHIEKTRLQLWGDQCKFRDPVTCTLRDSLPDLKKTVIRILGEIGGLTTDIDALVDKYDIKGPEVERMRKLITDLYGFTLQPLEAQLLTNGLPCSVLASVNRDDLLEVLSQLDTSTCRPLMLSARAKLHLKKIDVNPTGSATSVPSEQLAFSGPSSPSSSIALFSRSGDRKVAVQVEWNTVKAGSNMHRYVERINSLGYILQHVSDSDLRLPPCFGLIHGSSSNGGKKIGYIFGLPGAEHNHGPTIGNEYEEDLITYPPVSLTELIKGQNGRQIKLPGNRGSASIPILGDRFSLAYILACSFGRFHAAGWLHKGFHSRNIIFFQLKNGKGIQVTEPYIIGFQYSRPQDANSLSSGLLELKALEHYYHPDAKKGFTQGFDLYSLGVVLCEIGRWKLLAGPSKDLPKTREAWRDYLVNKVVEDLGWRMGERYQGVVRTLLIGQLPPDNAGYEYFAKQFMEKVMKPLASCSA
ncbi:hypothetical protein ANO14919_137420 [Xylariales sp. No.14919]|nr:hypothetical protein ANO14919_137420 [Xylariales sp. No.14919]